MGKLSRRDELVFEIEQIQYALKHEPTTQSERLNMIEREQECVRELIRLIKENQK